MLQLIYRLVYSLCAFATAIPLPSPEDHSAHTGPQSQKRLEEPSQVVTIRGREAQQKFFPGWKVLEVCSKKYIKNYPFFGIIYSIIITAQTLPCFFQLVAILSHFWPFFPPRRLIDLHNIFRMFNSCEYFISF